MDGERLKNKPLSFLSSAGLSCQDELIRWKKFIKTPSPPQPMPDLIPFREQCPTGSVGVTLLSIGNFPWPCTVLVTHYQLGHLPTLPLGTPACVQCWSESISTLPTISLLSLPTGWTWLLQPSSTSQTVSDPTALPYIALWQIQRP